MYKHTAITLIFIGFQGPVSGAEPDPWRGWNTPGEVRELILSAAARDRLGSDYNNLVWTGRLTPGQQAEYRSFLGELELRILTQCRKLFEQNPGKDFSMLPCPSGAVMSAPDLANVDTASEKIPEETVAALDAELRSELGQYDDMLLEEQKKIASRSPTRSQSSGWGSDAEAESGGMGGKDGDSARGARTASRDASSEDGEWEEFEDESETEPTDGRAPSSRSQSSRSSRVPGKADRQYEPPEDIPDGSDDDVVARQIREAAQGEQDPKLRKKLWEEYRRYKTAKR